jgi:hypothetical protein
MSLADLPPNGQPFFSRKVSQGTARRDGKTAGFLYPWSDKLEEIGKGRGRGFDVGVIAAILISVKKEVNR